MSLSFFNCQRTYFRICSSFKPTVLTQYPLAQKCLPQYRRFNSGCRSNTLIALFPFKNPTTSETEYFGGIPKTKCTWSICTFFSSISNLCHPQSSLIVSSTDFPIASLKIQNRYFGHQTKWYLHSQIACAKFLKLLIEYLLLSFRVTHLKLREVFNFIKSFLKIPLPNP